MYSVRHARCLEEWEALISSTFVPLTAEPEARREVTGTLSSRLLRELALTKVESTPQTVHRTSELVASSPGEYYKLNLQVSGHGLLLQDGKESALSPGDLAIYDTQRPYTLTFDEDFDVLVLLIPKHMVGLSSEDIGDITAVRLPRDHRLGQAVSPFLTHLGLLLPELDGPIAHRLATNVVDLLATMLADEVYSRPGGAPGDAARQLRRIHQFIDSQMANPDLSPAYVAAAHHMSVRSLHKLFETTGTTVSAWIKTRRLERCRRDLADPLIGAAPVAAIGARWGFTDPAHFSRAFRTEFGTSPAQYRKGGDDPAGTVIG